MTRSDELAREMWDEALRDEQSARRVRAEGDAEEIRRALRRLARAAGVGIRTAWMDGVVIAVRTDAAVWHQSAAVMRQKLAPREDEGASGPTRP